MSDFKERMKAELTELDERIAKLDKFLAEDKTVTGIDRSLMTRQLRFMERYSKVLTERVGNLKGE